MWRTSKSDRVLRGTEWELFRRGIESLWDWIEELDGAPGFVISGIRAFDRLQMGQQLHLLACVGRALGDEQAAQPELTANTEAAVAAIYSRIASEIDMEIDIADETRGAFDRDPFEDLACWRRLALAADHEVFAQEEYKAQVESQAAAVHEPDNEARDEDEPGDSLPTPHAASEDRDKWHYLVDALADRILWDADYEDGDEFLDDQPDVSRAKMAWARINDDYYTEIVPDPSGKHLESVRRILRSICERPGIA